MNGSGCQHLGYLVAAFGAVWLLVGGYVGILWRRERRLRREVEALRRSISGFTS
jgi:CcmD family protein